MRAAARAGAQHLVYISVVGADRVPVESGLDRAMFGYFAAKRAAEQVVADSGLPWTTLRATQFHDLVLTVARQLAKLPVMPVPAGVRFQPVDAGEVAARLAELVARRAVRPGARLRRAAGGTRWPSCSAATCGPAAGAGRSCRSGSPARRPGAVRAGANLAPERAVGRRTWEEFLAERLR